MVVFAVFCLTKLIRKEKNRHIVLNKQKKDIVILFYQITSQLNLHTEWQRTVFPADGIIKWGAQMFKIVIFSGKYIYMIIEYNCLLSTLLV